MIRIRHKILLSSLKTFDQAILFLCFFAATFLTYHQIESVSFSDFLALRIKTLNFVLLLCLMYISYAIFSTLVPYYGRRLSTLRTEIKNIVEATSLVTLTILLVGIIFSINIVNANFLFFFWGGATGIIILSRLFLKYLLSEVRLHGRNLRHILFVGINERALQFVNKLESKRELGFNIVGFVDNKEHITEEFKKTGYRVVADIKGLQCYLKDHVVDEVMLCLPIKTFYDEISGIVSLCEEQGLVVRFIPSIFDSKLAQSRIEEFEGENVITFFRATLHWQILLKRIIDFTIIMVLMPVLVPLFLLIALLIKLTSSGPVFFIQERIGFNKRRFDLYKFRTMFNGAEKNQSELEALNEASGPVFKIKNDPRITPIGKLLRKTSLDELPQIINVLKGDMSLVGPRPLPLRDYAGFDKDWHRRRLSVRPGITCFWQINGRSNTSFDEWMELDKQYIDNWSVWLDLKILVKTIPAVISFRGAV